MKLSTAIAFFIIYNSSLIISPVRAQFWHVLPPVGKGDEVAAGFSNDEKKIFYLHTEGGVGNVWSMVIMDKYGGIIAGPKNPPVQITKFTDRGVVRFFHLLNRPEFVFMRATENGKDFHIYRMKDDGSEQPQDLTPGGDGVTNTIIGASYNGRYVYYTNNAVHRDKVDVYRYDTQQFTSDLIFPNDKDYQVIAWTRDQSKLLLQDSSARSYMIYDIETTERTPLRIPPGENIFSVGLDPRDSLHSAGYKLETLGFKLFPNLKEKTDSTKLVKEMKKEGEFEEDYSPNCAYRIMHHHLFWSVTNVSTNESLPLPDASRPLAIAPKETLLVYLNGAKLYLYDIAKNKSTELASIQ